MAEKTTESATPVAQAQIDMQALIKGLADAINSGNENVIKTLKASEADKEEKTNSLKMDANKAAIRSSGFANEDRYEVRIPTSLKHVLGENTWVAVNGVAVNFPVNNTPVIVPESIALALMERLAKIDRHLQGKSNLDPFKSLVEENAKVADK